jgi:sigma-B regulation protein RsbU (phosphoserine phosphatase)
MALGIDNGENFDLFLEEKTIQLSPNDVVVLYTDGITEAMDEQGHEFGRENFHEAIRLAAGGTSQEIVDNIYERLKRFIGNHPQHDDMTLVVIKAL